VVSGEVNLDKSAKSDKDQFYIRRNKRSDVISKSRVEERMRSYSKSSEITEQKIQKQRMKKLIIDNNNYCKSIIEANRAEIRAVQREEFTRNKIESELQIVVKSIWIKLLYYFKLCHETRVIVYKRRKNEFDDAVYIRRIKTIQSFFLQILYKRKLRFQKLTFGITAQTFQLTSNLAHQRLLSQVRSLTRCFFIASILPQKLLYLSTRMIGRSRSCVDNISFFDGSEDAPAFGEKAPPAKKSGLRVGPPTRLAQRRNKR